MRRARSGGLHQGKAPPGAMGVLTDSEHEPRFAVGTTKDEIITYVKDVKKNKWNELTRSKYLGGGKISPVTFTEDDSSVIVLDDTNSSTAKIKAINLDDSTEEYYSITQNMIRIHNLLIGNLLP